MQRLTRHRIVLHPAAFAIAEPRIESRGLDAHRPEKDTFGAVLASLVFSPRDQRLAQSRAAMGLVDPEQIDIEPFPFKLPDKATDDIAVLVAQADGQRPGVSGTDLRLVMRAQPAHDGGAR